MEAISLVDEIAVIDEKKCIGCGVCSYHCPVSAIKLESTGIRDVFVPPAMR
jgi:Fe-S-cluster-containing hydrogenase component 2